MPSRIEEAFLPLYLQLRAIAQSRLAGNDGATLQATAVVHEALMRLSKRPIDSFTDEHHMLAAAAQAIRHVIVDHARRRKNGLKVDSQEQTEMLESVAGLNEPRRVDLLVDLDLAMNEMSETDPQLRTIVELHTFGGLSHAEIAALLSASERTIRRRWKYAAAVLRHKLHDWSDSSDD